MNLHVLVAVSLWAMPVVGAAQAKPDEQIKTFIGQFCQAQAEMSLANVATQYWILDAQTLLWYSLDDGKLQTYTADQLKASQAAPAQKGACAVSDIKIVLQGTVASVSFNEKTIFPDGTSLERIALGCVELSGSAWKMHLLTYHTVDKRK